MIDEPKGSLIPALIINHLSNCIIPANSEFIILGTGFNTVDPDLCPENFDNNVNITNTGNKTVLKKLINAILKSFDSINFLICCLLYLLWW